MIETIDKVVKSILKYGPYFKRIEDNRKKVYELSRFLDEEQGYELMNLFDDTVKQSEKVYKKMYQGDARKEE